MDKLEKEVLALLEEDSRLSPQRIAAALGADVKEIENTVRSLEESGAIVKYTTIVNADLTDEEKVEALIEVKVTPQRGLGFDAIAEEIAAHDEVKNLYLMSGAFDLTVIVEGKSLREVSRFVSEKISTYDNVLSTATHFILKKYKVEGASMKKNERENRLSVQA